MAGLCGAPALAEVHSGIQEIHTLSVIAESKEKPERESDYTKHLFFRPSDVLYLMLFAHAE